MSSETLAARDWQITGSKLSRIMRLESEAKNRWGGWGDVPHEVKDWLAILRRSAGLVYEPTSGWMNRHNSVSLSSIHSK